MPCIFLKNFPVSFSASGAHVEHLRLQIAGAAKCPPEAVEIHVSHQDYRLLTDNGLLEPCGNIHGFLLWFVKEERDRKVKQTIADALQNFLNQYSIGIGFDLSFIDLPAGSFYIEDEGRSVMVKGGEPPVPFSILSLMAYQDSGWFDPEFDPEDPEA